jgi:hypothetical protein
MSRSLLHGHVGHLRSLIHLLHRHRDHLGHSIGHGIVSHGSLTGLGNHVLHGNEHGLSISILRHFSDVS